MTAPEDRKEGAADWIPCQDAAFTMVDLLVDRLIEEAEQAPFGLDAATLRRLAREFRDDPPQTACQDLHHRFEACMKEREKALWDRARRNAFERVLIKRFSRLFPDEGELAIDSSKISRRIIPGFVQAIGMMAGHDYLEECRTTCRDILREKKRERRNNFQWPDLYDDPRANQVIDDVLVTMAPHFRDFGHRIDWMYGVIRDHLALPEDYAFEGEGVYQWDVDRRDVRNMIRFLYHPLLHRLEQTGARAELTERYSPTAIEALEALRRNLYGQA